jgi:hypothetical protein
MKEKKKPPDEPRAEDFHPKGGGKTGESALL